MLGGGKKCESFPNIGKVNLKRKIGKAHPPTRLADLHIKSSTVAKINAVEKSNFFKIYVNCDMKYV